MIKVIPADLVEWKRVRSGAPFKHLNIPRLDHLNKLMAQAVSDIGIGEGIVAYQHGSRRNDILPKPFIFYDYGSPAPNLARIQPDGYGFQYFKPNDIYKKSATVKGLQRQLYEQYITGGFTRYVQPEVPSSLTLPDNYILFAMNNLFSNAGMRGGIGHITEEIAQWARDNKRHVVYKWHMGCADLKYGGVFNTPQDWFDRLLGIVPSDYIHFDTTTPLHVLVKNCSAFWSGTSMAGVEALACNKPVVVFGRTNYMEMAVRAVNPDQAATATTPHPDIEQWLSYFINHYSIDTDAPNALDRITRRLYGHFVKQLPLDQLMYY